MQVQEVMCLHPRISTPPSCGPSRRTGTSRRTPLVGTTFLAIRKMGRRPVSNHPAPQGLHRHPQPMDLGELLVGERRPEVRVMRPHPLQYLAAQPLRQPVVATPPPAPRHQPLRALAPVAAQQPLHLTHTHRKLPSRLALLHPPRHQRLHHPHPVQLLPAHTQDLLCQRLTPLGCHQKGTFLPCTEGTLLLGANIFATSDLDSRRPRTYDNRSSLGRQPRA